MSSPAFNRVILMGNFARDPELRYTPGGSAVTDFRLGINERFGEKNITTFIDVVAWNKTAENICAYMHKGDSIHIEGRIGVETWDDRVTGKKMSRVKVVVGHCLFLSSKNRTGRTGGEATRPAQDKLETGVPSAGDDDFGRNSGDPGDIPF